MKRKKHKKIGFLLPIVFNCCLIVAVLVLMRHAQNLLNSDAKVNLMEVVSQNRDVISSRLKLEVNNVQNVASRVSDDIVKEDTISGETLKNILTSKKLGADTQEMFMADKDGRAYYPDGKEVDISGRRYFKLALKGKQNISDKLITRSDGVEGFIISVPLHKNNTVIGTIQKFLSYEKMYELCAISLFSSQGYMHIVNSEGYTILHTPHTNCRQRSDNFFRDVYAWDNENQSEKLQRDIQENQSGFIQYTVNEVENFAAYAPIDEIHDWYLITSVPIKAVSGNGSVVINLFYVILLSVVLVFGISILYFISFKNKQKQNLENIAFIDSVTGGNTYGKFVLDAEEILAANPDKSFAIFKFDMDNFRFVNSYYGFDFGDQLLKQIYVKIVGQLEGQEVAARITGDNFVALLEHYDEKRLNAMLDSLYSEEFTIYLSAGVYIIKREAQESISLMVDKAGTAARSIKGSMNLKLEYYSSKFDDAFVHNEQLKRAVSQAIGNSEFLPFYQPKIDIETGKMVGAEALARWRTAENKLISPGEFIPMCEKTGSVVEVDMIIFEKTLRFLRKRINKGEPCVPISVNFSRVHLLDEEFLEKIDGLLGKYEVPSQLVEVELTESAFFDNRNSILQFVDGLRGLGIKVAMDDFGSGYSSLNMLKNIPIDILKIDRGFLLASEQPGKRDILFESVVEMVRRLGIDIVVEGVEYIENVELMRKCGCSIAQGYYYARPMEEEQFVEFARGKTEC